ncbi:8-amino-7-oxononanoate synthase [Shouchella lonarensis]|uniref:8-amino-7-ketopelargonate synthase n=1 Tax=Shouchella lonarensis TaxID=1464122 RepID=A0A1G6HTK3_9BACI|nr:8-amino-7-oxononanoate synthase [Shouchella lonarensis]SDB97478.1 8-amino-7-oxononanoate synthase [Shouchella lonarensis]
MSAFNHWLQQRLTKTKEAGLYRECRTMHGAPRPEMVVEGERQLVFSSNNYLGLAGDSRLVAAAENALQAFGVGSSGSRLTTGHTTWHKKLEETLAAFKQTEAALLFSSGYLANIGVLSSLPTQQDVIFSDQFNHASIIDGCRLSKAKTVVYRHVDMDDLEEKLAQATTYERRFIVTDGVFSMDGTIAPLDQTMQLAERYDAFVIVDDAHGTGVLGEHGRGTCAYFQVKPHVLIGTLSKAVGAEGGYVAGSRALIDFLRNHARSFIFQTSLPPAICAAADAALEIIAHDEEKRHRLAKNAREIRTRLQELGYTVYGDNTPIIPVIIGATDQAVRVAKQLQDVGIYAPAIRPPTVPDGESRIRLTVTADHCDAHIAHLITTFQEIGTELRQPL